MENHSWASSIPCWLEVQNKSSQKNLISLGEHSSLIHHSELSSSSLSSSKEYFGSLLDFSFVLRSSFMGASGGELAVGLVKRQPNEKAMALILSSSDFPSNSFATLGSISFDEIDRDWRYRGGEMFWCKRLSREKYLTHSCLKGNFLPETFDQSG